MAGILITVGAVIWLVSLYALCETGTPRQHRARSRFDTERRRQQAAIDADRRAAERAMWQIAKRRWHQ